MMRSKPSSSMQKTYDECYLICSTAVYFEGQNNEAEALRSWRSALETIYYHNAYRVPPNYVPKTETEKALQESIRELEMQCKERVALLEALQESRKEALQDKKGKHTATAISSSREGKSPLLNNETRPVTTTTTTTPGWIGEGTIPAVDYLDLSRPPPLPARPKQSSEPVLQRGASGSSVRSVSHSIPSPPTLPSPATTKSSTTKTSSRASSPEKRKTMRTTLRTKDPKKSSKNKASPGGKETRPAASKAAGLAWGSIAPRSSSSEKVQHDAAAAVASSRYSISSDPGLKRDQGFTSGDDEGSRHGSRRSRDPSDHIPSWSWREPQYPERSPRRTSAGTPISLPPSTPGPPSDRTSPSSRMPAADVRDQLASKYSPRPPPPRPVVGPKPAALRSSPTESIGNQATRSYSSPQHLPTKPVAEEAKRTLRNSSQPKPPASSSSSNKASPKPTANGQHVSNSSGRSGDDERLSRAVRKLDIRDSSNTSSRAGERKKTSSARPKPKVTPPSSDDQEESSDDNGSETEEDKTIWNIMKRLPKGVDPHAARQILNDIVVRGDEVHWDDIAGLDAAKKALKEAVVYPFLRPDLFSGLREPARGMLLFGPPGTGKTMLARAVATESKSTFFSVSASSLTSKWHGESEKLVRALFGLAKAMAPSIIFVDEIDSLLSSRSSGSEHEASRRSKTEFLIQWSDLQRAAAGREHDGDASRVLVLAATNMPWDIDEAARRRFVRRQYIPLPEREIREQQIRKLLSHQKHELTDDDIEVLVQVTEGYSGSDITALAKDAAMGPLRNLGEALLHTPMEKIRPIRFKDFEASLYSIRPSISRDGLKQYEDWARRFGERGG
ncbi:putative AAA family ATPase [Thermoascus aurantiacus ATCC 26904]